MPAFELKLQYSEYFDAVLNLFQSLYLQFILDELFLDFLNFKLVFSG
jgi:hypothetical protein